MNPEIIPYYIEINVFTFVLLLVIYQNISRRQVLFPSEMLFKSTIVVTMVAMISDTIATAFEGILFPGAVAINWVLDTIYFEASLLIPFMYFGYVRTVIEPDCKFKSFQAQIISIPFYIYSVIILTSYWTGWVFRVSPDNIYSRGPLRSWHSIIAGVILLISVAHTVYHILKKDIKKEQARYLLALPVFPVIGVFVRSVAVGSNLIWSAMTIGLLICFIHEQNSMIYVDSLTGLNNRGRSDQYLVKQLENLESNKRLFFAIVDINYFKQINDTYGHAEGDEALRVFSDILKKAASEKHDFIARFGGDEFVIVANRDIEDTIEDTLARVDFELEMYNASSNKGYKLSCSHGYTSTTLEEGKTLDQLLNDADEEMYHVKQKFHCNSESILV